MKWLQLYRIIFFIGILVIPLSLFIDKDKLYILFTGIIVIIISLFEQWDIKRIKYIKRSKESVIASKIPTVEKVTEPSINYQTKSSPYFNEKEIKKEKFSFFSIFKRKKAEAEKSVQSQIKMPSVPLKTQIIPEVKKGLIEEKKPKHSLFGFFKREKIEIKELPKVEMPFEKPLEKKEIKKQLSQKPQDIAVFKTEYDKKKILLDYIKKALKSKFPKDKIKEAALLNGWPEDLFEECYSEVTKTHKTINILIALALLIAATVVVIILIKLDIFILPYFIKTIKYASPLFYLGLLIIFLFLILLFTYKIKKALKKKKVEYRAEEEQNVEYIKEAITKISGSYETDLDKLYKILEEKQKLTLSEVAKAFSISKTEAEEWGKIMRDHDLIVMHYPTVGDPELIWKKLKSTQ